MTGISYAVSHRGGTHQDGRPIYFPNESENEQSSGDRFAGMAELCASTFDNSTIGDSLVLCRFIQERTFGYALTEAYAEYIRALTGWDDYDLAEVSETAERICTIERLISTDRGLDRNHDTLPYRVRNEPIPAGPSAGRCCDDATLETLKDQYYALRRWDDLGRPTGESADRLRVRRGDVPWLL